MSLRERIEWVFRMGLLVFILGLSAVTLRTLRAILSRTRLHLPSALRHGLANLYRPGNQSAAVLAALAIADELEALRAGREGQDDAVRQRAERCLELVERALRQSA